MAPREKSIIVKPPARDAEIPALPPAAKELPWELMTLPRCFTMAALALALGACGTEPKEQEPRADAPVLVGRIAMVNEARGFALVEGYAERGVGPGMLLSSFGPEDRAATLVATGESIGRFMAADLKSGTVGVGDGVYARPRGETGEEFTADPQPAAP